MGKQGPPLTFLRQAEILRYQVQIGADLMELASSGYRHIVSVLVTSYEWNQERNDKASEKPCCPNAATSKIAHIVRAAR